MQASVYQNRANIRSEHSSEVLQHPHVAIHCPAIEFQVAPIGRRMCQRFQGNSGVFPYDMRIALKIHVKNYRPASDVRSEQTDSSRRQPKSNSADGSSLSTEPSEEFLHGENIWRWGRPCLEGQRIVYHLARHSASNYRHSNPGQTERVQLLVPFMGSKAETVNCSPSSVGSPIAHNSDGDLAQVSKLPGLAVNSGCGGPPARDARITGSGPLMGQGPFSLSPK